MPRAATAPAPKLRSTRAVKQAANDEVLPIGNIIDKLATNRDQKRALEAEIKNLESEWVTIEEQLIARMKKEGTDLCRGSGFSASVQTKTNYTVPPEGWEEMVKWCVKNKRTDILYRRVSNPSVEELLSLGKQVPNVEAFTREVISLRKL